MRSLLLLTLICGLISASAAEVAPDTKPATEAENKAQTEQADDAKSCELKESAEVSAPVNLASALAALAEHFAEQGETVALEEYVDDSRKADPTLPYQAGTALGVSKQTRCSSLENFCLDNDGNLLLCDNRAQLIKKIDQADKLLATWKVSVKPEAIAVQANGTIVVGGQNSVILLDKNGKEIAKQDLPESTAKPRTITYDDDGVERTYTYQPSQGPVTSIGCNGTDCFVAARLNHGYSVLRFPLDLSQSGTEVLKKQSGCCGQYDISANTEGFVVAANGRHQVQSYDREGKQVLAFGQRSRGRSDKANFGGCCDPMNVCMAPNGLIVTSESDTGQIKAFNAKGELDAVLAVVTQGSGCKRVQVAMSKDHSRIFVLDTEQSRIHTMEKKPDQPKAESAPKAPVQQ